MGKANYYSNILKKGTIIFNCGSFVNHCSDIKNTSDPEYEKLMKDNKELGTLNSLIRGLVSDIDKDRNKESD